MRTAHLVSSAAWLGGSLFYAYVLGRRLAGVEEARAVLPAVAEAFGKVVSASAWTLLASGGYLTFTRLTHEPGVPYAAVLALKILLAVWMILLAGALGRSRSRRRRPARTVPPPRRQTFLPVPTLILVLGLIVFALSAILTTIYRGA